MLVEVVKSMHDSCPHRVGVAVSVAHDRVYDGGQMGLNKVAMVCNARG